MVGVLEDRGGEGVGKEGETTMDASFHRRGLCCIFLDHVEEAHRKIGNEILYTIPVKHHDSFLMNGPTR